MSDGGTGEIWNGMLLQEIRITHVMDCLGDPSKIRVVAELSADIQEILPYLATLLPQAGYNHQAALLTMVLEGRLITVYPLVVTVAKAQDDDDARAVLDWLRRTINDAYARRDEITPCLERRRSPRMLEIYRLLPRTNCRRCGEATCIALAVRLALGEARLETCEGLLDAGFSHNRRLLGEWLGVANRIAS